MTETDQPAAAATSRIEVVAGGAPTPEELAAVVVALTPAGGGGDAVPSVPAWARAALLEGAGHRRPARPSDLDVVRRLG